MDKTARLKRLSRHLLATTCLTVAAVGAAHATTINESSAPGADFSNTGPGTLLSSIAPLTLPGSNTVNGTITGFGDTDFFIFSGEQVGAVFSYDMTVSNGQGHLAVVNSLGVNIGSNTPFLFNASTPAIGTGIVPADGEIILGVTQNCECGFTYQATVVAPVAPEPSTLADLGLGLGLAGAVALRRKLKTRQA